MYFDDSPTSSTAGGPQKEEKLLSIDSPIINIWRVVICVDAHTLLLFFLFLLHTCNSTGFRRRRLLRVWWRWRIEQPLFNLNCKDRNQFYYLVYIYKYLLVVHWSTEWNKNHGNHECHIAHLFKIWNRQNWLKTNILLFGM